MRKLFLLMFCWPFLTQAQVNQDSIIIKKMSDEIKSKMSIARKGKKMSEEAKQKMKIAAKNREENKRKQKDLT